eukprot:scaffold14992_cov69-Phaeocystis_antarctica.AAC.9
MEGALSDGADLAAREPAGQPGRGGRAERLGQLAALGARLAVQAGAWVRNVQRGRQLRRGPTESAASESELSGAAGRDELGPALTARGGQAAELWHCQDGALAMLRRRAPGTTRASRPRRRGGPRRRRRRRTRRRGHAARPLRRRASGGAAAGEHLAARVAPAPRLDGQRWAKGGPNVGQTWAEREPNVAAFGCGRNAVARHRALGDSRGASEPTGRPQKRGRSSALQHAGPPPCASRRAPRAAGTVVGSAPAKDGVSSHAARTELQRATLSAVADDRPDHVLRRVRDARRRRRRRRRATRPGCRSAGHRETGHQRAATDSRLRTQQLVQRLVLPDGRAIELEHGDPLRLGDGEAGAHRRGALAHQRIQRDALQRDARHAAVVPLGADV